MSAVKAERNAMATIAELPIVLWVMLLVLAYPMISMAMITTRYGFLLSASRDGAHAGARAKTFSQNASASELSAVNATDQRVRNAVSSFDGINIQSISVNIVITDLQTNQVTRQQTALQSPADVSRNLYQIENIVTADIQPFITVNGSFSGIPGLTAPIRVTVSSRECCESPQGLTI